jgi:hypothetical protein
MSPFQYRELGRLIHADNSSTAQPQESRIGEVRREGFRRHTPSNV